MPVFEYRCADCNNKFEVFHKSTNHQDEVVCPSCNSSNNKKLLSSFSASFEGSTSSPDSYSNSSDTGYSGGCASGICGIN